MHGSILVGKACSEGVTGKVRRNGGPAERFGTKMIKYPLILEIHGGPFANYGPRFAADMQMYAAAGYVVLYANPRGSTSYGEEFGNLIHHA